MQSSTIHYIEGNRKLCASYEEKKSLKAGSELFQIPLVSNFKAHEFCKFWIVIYVIYFFGSH